MLWLTSPSSAAPDPLHAPHLCPGPLMETHCRLAEAASSSSSAGQGRLNRNPVTRVSIPYGVITLYRPFIRGGALHEIIDEQKVRKMRAIEEKLKVYWNKAFFSLCNEWLTWDGTFLGGSIRMVGSHSPGGSTVTWSRNSSIPERRSILSLALYATSWNIYRGE